MMNNSKIKLNTITYISPKYGKVKFSKPKIANELDAYKEGYRMGIRHCVEHLRIVRAVDGYNLHDRQVILDCINKIEGIK